MRRRNNPLTVLATWVAMVAISLAHQGAVRSAAADSPAPADTSGTAVMQWSYDRWSAPWVQVSGGAHLLAPASSAILMVLDCEAADLEGDRLARHLSAAECEHRMAAIRAGQDTTLLFRLDLRLINLPGAAGLARLGRGTTIRLEDDRGRRWYPIETLRGPVVNVPGRQGLKRVYDYSYAPPWVRDTRSGHPYRYEPSGGDPISIAQHRARFARRDPRTTDLVVTPSTRWLRLHLVNGSYEWVATWVFRSEPAFPR